MIICLCNKLNTADLKKALDNKCIDVESVFNFYNKKIDCNSCYNEIKSYIDLNIK